MSPDRYHFIAYKASEGQEFKGIAAGLKIEVRGALKFIIDYNDGIKQTINVPNSVYIPDLSMVLVSPKHWAHQTSEVTKSTSCAKISILIFRGYRKTIPYSTQYNTPSFLSASRTLC